MAEDMDIPMPRMVPAGGGTGAWRTSRPSQPMDAGTRRLAIFAGAIGGGLLLLVGVWSFSGRHHAGIPVVEADSRPLRTKPEDRGGMQLTGGDDAILSGTSDGKDAMAPPPETPAPQALREATPPAPLPAVPPAIAQATAPAPAAPAPPAATPQPAAPVAVAASTPKAVPVPPVAAPRPLAPHAGGPVVQLGALSSEDLAHTEWQRLTHKLPDLLGGRAPSFSRLDRDGKSFWRLRTTGFADVAQATAFCAQVRARGGACALAGG